MHGTCLPRDDRRVGRQAERLAHLCAHARRGGDWAVAADIHRGHYRRASPDVEQALHRVQRAHAAAPRQVVLGQAAVRRLALIHKGGGEQ